MSEELSVRPAQLRSAQRTDKVQTVATHLEKAAPALAAHGKVAAAEKALNVSSKLESRAEKGRTSRAKDGASEYGGTPDVTGKGQQVDYRVY